MSEQAIKPRPSLDMYPDVPMPVMDTLTWDAIANLARHEPAVRAYAIWAERGDLTREQALVAMVYALYNQKAGLFRAEVERRRMEEPDFVIVGGQRYDRRR